MDTLTNKEIIAGFFEIYNNKDYEAVYRYFSPHYVDHGLPQVKSLEQVIGILKLTHKSFPDLQVIINDLIEENNQVVFRGRFSGTHLGEFANLPPGGAKVEFEALEIFKIENQKITESWGYWPLSEIINQITAAANQKQ
ncbi:SnoaL-like polyketide cyclase [Planktothrix tepida]|uniref:SnoaL-like polyketide cyclase n=2 Tax=Planktothrix TaxID=54304 RepID=A0A1J1LKE9_9CYAN|nr:MULTISPECIES: ester cyclase [Planktothrix]CAD5951852.1 SnoaL-like polyketide cyclase [Planktothrix tepida]CAD5958868.1 SnoaL-like polyketide cyclase [Planktothrix pseudagardhii]CUR32654.1 SnoaL-like polyketide cyclase [Planktothrix tepida PCC 9214]